MAVKFNKGDISEAILCAAIAAKFKKRLSARQLNNDPIISIGDLPPINYQDVRSVLTDMVGSGYTSNYSVRDRNIATKKVVLKHKGIKLAYLEINSQKVDGSKSRSR